MRGMLDDDQGADVRELRALLKSARNDVKRYASHVVRLQQELDRARLGAPTIAPTAQNDELDLVAQDLQDAEVESVTNQAANARQVLNKLGRETTNVCKVCRDRPGHTDVNEDSKDTVKQRVKAVMDVLTAQTRQIETLARENAKLRDTLDKQPTHRDLARSQWQVERLQLQVARLREDRQWNNQHDDDPGIPVFDTPPQETLTDRISVDKLLSWLHVETKRVKHSAETPAKRNRRRFMKEPIECYLVLDSAALDGPTTMDSSAMTETDKMKKREQLSRRVGIVCSEIVASCCHTVGVYEVANLPRYVESTYQYAQLVPYLQEFVHRIDDLTLAATMGTKTTRGEAKEKTTESFLETVSSRVQDLVFEVRSRREQMQPPGDRAFAVVLRCMKLLQAERIDELAPTIEALIEAARKEKEFLCDARKVLGVDVTAPRATVLDLITKLMEQVGLSPASSKSAKQRTSLHNHDRLTSSRRG